MNTLFRTSFALLTISLLVVFAARSSSADPAGPSVVDRSADHLVVHEWGTFTVLQDEQGRQLGAINVDDEPLPNFVHKGLNGMLQSGAEIPNLLAKGIGPAHRDVIVRLETPVVYFYPPRDRPSFEVDVEVAFRGGWLTEFYPNADAKFPGVQTKPFRIGRIRPDAVGTLAWKGLAVGGRQDGPETDSQVWLAPRNVRAASVRTPKGEAERYLFYRGVGNLPVPLKAVRTESDALMLHADRDVRSILLVDVRPDGSLAFRGRESLAAGGKAPMPATFDEADYAEGNLAMLRKELAAALLRDGLFAEEAEAMMNTWEAAYFKQPGLRLFFLVPDAWTDEVLPLKIRAGDLEKNMKVERAMIGRIELVTPAQRERLTRIARTPPAPQAWAFAALGEAKLEGAAAKMPPEYRDYLDLGRFRNALLLDELDRRPTEHLKKFAGQYGIRYHVVQENDAAVFGPTLPVLKEEAAR